MYGLVEGTCPDCQGRDFHFDAIARAGVYDKALQRMILAFKWGRTELDSVLGLLVRSAFEGSPFYEDVEQLVPVPLHWTRRLVRGYNQARILAGKTRHSGVEICTDLVRMRRTKKQPAMPSDAARAKNVAGAFAVRRGHRFEGKVVCLVDDIKTSGSTLSECAKTLKDAGARTVCALVVAVAGQKLG